MSHNSRFWWHVATKSQIFDCNDAKMTVRNILCPDCDLIIQYYTQIILRYYGRSFFKAWNPYLWNVNSQTTNQFSEDGRSRRLKEQAAKFCHDINKLRERTNNRQRDLDSVSHLIFFVARGTEYDYKMNWFRYI